MALSLTDKLEMVVAILSTPIEDAPPPTERWLLLIYPPEEELIFRQRLDEYLLQLKVPYRVIELETLPFECLDAQGVLEDAFRLEAEDSLGLRQYLAEQLPRVLRQKVLEAAQKMPAGGVIILKSTSSLFPWVKYADFLSQLPNGFPCYIVIPFPGHEQGAYLHFLGHRDGFNYLARRIA